MELGNMDEQNEMNKQTTIVWCCLMNPLEWCLFFVLFKQKLKALFC